MKNRLPRFSVLLLSVLFLFIVSSPQYAQEADPALEAPDTENAANIESDDFTQTENGEAAGEAQVLTPEQNLIEMDIKTSSLTELAAWSRSLGLSEGGTKTDLARRLRDHFSIVESIVTLEDTRKIITIEAARSTEYFKLEVVDEEYARLTGDVRVSLKDGDAIHRIRAWEILFNRTRNVLSAFGGVEYIKEEGETVETFRGESITVDLDDWSSIFLGGVSERSLQSDGTTYRFAGTVISRNDEEVTVLTKAAISNANNGEALWSLNASRVWLLPGSDFGIFNAVLKVGEIPVLYIPFFYYPADEVIFHPVIGFRTREGNFVQTSTYILGRPKSDSTSQSSLTRILGNSSDMEKKREGIFLRSTGKKVTDPDKASLKAIVDYYANLGGYLGAELTTPRLGILNAIDLSMGFGFSRTVFLDTAGNYSPYIAANNDGSSDWNRSNLFSQDVPFRYRFKTSSSIGGKFGSLSWSFPFYSDPFVDRDFLDRAESMDWVNMVQQGAAIEAGTTTENQVTNYQWQLSGQVTPSIPKLSPYVSSLSLSGISSTVAFKTGTLLTTNPNYNKDSPTRMFFYPDSFTIYNMTGSLAGTPLTLGGGTTAQTAAEKPEEKEEPLSKIGVPRSPWDVPEEEPEGVKSVEEKLVPPVLGQRFDLPRRGNARFSIDYRVSPTSASELQFNSSKWKEYTDIDWSDVASILSTFGGDASTSLNLSHSDGFYTNAFTFSGNGTWRQFNYLNEEADAYLDASGNPDPTLISAARKREYSQSFFNTSWGYVGTVRPLYRNSMWSNSNLQYSLKGLAAKSVFLDAVSTGDDPQWEIQYGDWEKDKIDTHQFAANLAASVMDKVQNFTISADLPPREAAVSGNATFRVWITETNAHMRILNPGEEDKRKFEPFYSTETFRFGNLGSLVHYMVLDAELKEFTTITSTLTLLGISAAYSATRSQGYELDPSLGWILSTGDPSLQSRDITLAYSKTFTKADLWKKRLHFSVNVSSRLFFDLQRYTNSNFGFTLGFTLGISNFLDLSLSGTTENAVIYRYFKDWPIFKDLPVTLPDGEQNNLFIDLFNSFRFDDENRRRSSGFKMKTFRLSATHHLGDWNAILDVGLSPYRPEGSLQYEFNSEISFVVQWIPVTEIKSDMKYNKRNDEWIVK